MQIHVDFFLYLVLAVEKMSNHVNAISNYYSRREAND